MSRLMYGFRRLTGTARRSSRWMILSGIGLSVLALVLPQLAAAEAVPGPESTPGPSGLPDGRVYEQVSPTNKDGNQAAGPVTGTAPYVAAGDDGDGVAFSKTGPFGEASSGLDFFSIARRSTAGWKTRAAVARGEGVQGIFLTNPQSGLGFSADMGASVFGTSSVFVPEQEHEQLSPTPHLYRYSEDGSVQWIGKPTIAEPVRYKQTTDRGELAGASPDYNTIYYTFGGALVQADEEPDPSLGNLTYDETVRGAAGVSDASFYEWHDGTLEAAGVLPDGHLDPYGSVPASTFTSSEIAAETLNNQVSEDGSTAFFVSPDPGANSGRPPELYVRLTAPDGTQSTKLVSRDMLLPQSGGQPAISPTGMLSIEGSFYASPDGSHAFFQSLDQLTANAPADTSVKEYEFDTQTDAISYLPGVADLPFTPCQFCGAPSIKVLGMSRNGSNFVFKREGMLDLWNQGTVSEIAAIENAPVVTRATPTGSVYAFQLQSSLAKFAFNNGGGAYSEVYRYETAGDALGCVSCPPAGVTPSGDAVLSNALPSGAIGNTFAIITGNHGISEDGSRVFFDTPDPLLAQDTNGLRDAYEWEDGVAYLISTGVSKRASFSGDNSPNGNDDFFSTAEGLAPGDTDEGYDLYDARVPRPGDQPPPSAVPCEGAVCQGPPSVPQLLSPPASQEFNGAGNLTPLPAGKAAPKSLTRAQKLARALRACERRRGARARKKCVRQARSRYGAKAARASGSSGNRHHNGRGK